MRWLMLLVAAGFLHACSDDAPDTSAPKESRPTAEVKVRPYTSWFQEESMASRTRAFPEDYKDENDKTYKIYSALFGEDGSFKLQINLIHADIGLYFTEQGITPPSEYVKIFYTNVTKVWGSSVTINPGTYYLYGFIPDGVAEKGSEIAANGDFKDGAVLKLKKLCTITPNDVCVVVAAGRGDNDTGPNTGFGIGKFKYELAGGDNNFIYLLFNHLYSSLRFNFTVVDSYSQLRTIKLKKLQLQTEEMWKYADATITLTANNDGTSPISSVTFSSDPYTSEGKADGILFQDYDHPVVLETGKSADILGCFLPVVDGGSDEFTLVSTYDVYDTAGNLIRQNCTAENKIKLSELTSSPSLSRGTMVTVDLKVVPSYLYVLSEPDLDNPTIKIN